MLVALIMGFASGLPLLLTKGVLQAWMNRESIDLTLIGLTSLLALPYSIKFIWAPFFDRFTLSFLGRRSGARPSGAPRGERGPVQTRGQKANGFPADMAEGSFRGRERYSERGWASL